MTSERTRLLRAELEVAELEDELASAKESGEVGNDLKVQVREARQRFREIRGVPEPGPGDAVAAPDTIEGKADVKKAGTK